MRFNNNLLAAFEAAAATPASRRASTAACKIPGFNIECGFVSFSVCLFGTSEVGMWYHSLHE